MWHPDLGGPAVTLSQKLLVLPVRKGLHDVQDEFLMAKSSRPYCIVFYSCQHVHQ